MLGLSFVAFAQRTCTDLVMALLRMVTKYSAVIDVLILSPSIVRVSCAHVFLLAKGTAPDLVAASSITDWLLRPLRRKDCDCQIIRVNQKLYFQRHVEEPRRRWYSVLQVTPIVMSIVHLIGNYSIFHFRLLVRFTLFVAYHLFFYHGLLLLVLLYILGEEGRRRCKLAIYSGFFSYLNHYISRKVFSSSHLFLLSMLCISDTIFRSIILL